jgi:hypothetical protein
MQRFLNVLMIGCLFARSAACLAEGEKADPRAIVQKAIEAMGGESKLAAAKASVAKGTCKFYGNGKAIECTGEWSEQLPGQLKAAYVMNVRGKKLTRVEVITKDAGWTVMGGRTRAVFAEQLADIHEGMEAFYASTLLLPLKEPEYRLSSIGDSKIDGRPAVGVKVARQGHREGVLYFDKDRGYLLKLQIRVKGIDGREVDEETLYSDYRDFDGTRSYSKTITKRDGKIFLECDITEFKAYEKLPPGTFDKPESGEFKKARVAPAQ